MKWFGTPPGFVLLAVVMALCALTSFVLDGNTVMGIIFVVLSLGAVARAVQGYRLLQRSRSGTGVER